MEIHRNRDFYPFKEDLSDSPTQNDSKKVLRNIRNMFSFTVGTFELLLELLE
jgi:hypothetical protein